MKSKANHFAACSLAIALATPMLEGATGTRVASENDPTHPAPPAEEATSSPSPHTAGQPAGGDEAKPGSDEATNRFGKRAHGPLHAFHELDMTERKRLREALQAVVDDPAVTAAREQLRAASENLKATLRSAIAREDPELAPLLRGILDKKGPGRPESPRGPHGNRKPAPPWMGGMRPGAFPENPADYLQGEILRRVLESHRQELREAHHAVIQEPVIREVLEKLTATDPSSEQKHPLRKQLRESYLAEMEKRVPGIGKLLHRGMTNSPGTRLPDSHD